MGMMMVLGNAQWVVKTCATTTATNDWEEEFCNYTPNDSTPDVGEPSIRQYGSSSTVCDDDDSLGASFCDTSGYFEIAYAVTTLTYYNTVLSSSTYANAAAMWNASPQPADVYR